MKRWIRMLYLMLMLFMIATLFLPYSVGQAAAPNPRDKISNAIVLMIGRAETYSKGLPAMIDAKNPDVYPVVKDGRTLVPVRFIAENFGAKVGWDGSTSTATISMGDKVIRLTLGSSTMLVNDQPVILDVPADSINDRTFIPLRALTDVLGKKLFWDNRGLIVISDNDKLFDAVKDKAQIDSVVGMFNEGYLNVFVDPRFELLTVIEYLSGYAERWPNKFTRYDFEYKRKIDKYFQPYKEHEVIKLFEEMSSRAFNGDDPVITMLYLSNPPDLEEVHQIDGDTKRNAGGAKKLENFIAAMRDFAVQSNFMSFYNSNKTFYDELIRDYYYNVENSLISEMEKYIGIKQHSYNVILVPLLHSGGYGPSLKRSDGSSDIYSINGPQTINKDKPVFIQNSELAQNLVWHAFEYSYINPLSEKYWEKLSQYSNLIAPMAPYISNPYWIYGNRWSETIVNEHITRAIISRLEYKLLGKNAANSKLEKDLNSGFVYVEHLYKCLEEYENNRDKYPTINDFYPKLVDVFKELSEKAKN